MSVVGIPSDRHPGAAAAYSIGVAIGVAGVWAAVRVVELGTGARQVEAAIVPHDR